MEAITLGFNQTFRFANGLLGIAIFVAVSALLFFVFSSVISFIGTLFLAIGFAVIALGFKYQKRY